jgi:hypothetical protein
MGALGSATQDVIIAPQPAGNEDRWLLSLVFVRVTVVSAEVCRVTRRSCEANPREFTTGTEDSFNVGIAWGEIRCAVDASRARWQVEHPEIGAAAVVRATTIASAAQRTQVVNRVPASGRPWMNMIELEVGGAPAPCAAVVVS